MINYPLNQQKILEYLKDNGKSKCADIAKYIGLSESRTRAIINNVKEIESIGINKKRTYRLK